MRAYLQLFRRFVLRALAREKMRSGITVLGISLGVAVMIAIRIANASAIGSFRAATQSVAGETSIQVTGAAGRFDETKLRDLAWLSEYGQASPVIEGHMVTGRDAGASGSIEGEMLQVLGVDVLRDRSLRRYRLLRLTEEHTEPSAREFLLLLTDPKAIILTEKFARRRGLSIGSAASFVIGDTKREFVVRGLLLDEGPARALEGNFALMDIAAAQWAFNRLGLIDRIDVKLRANLSLDEAEAQIAARLPEGLVVRRPEASYGQVEKMISAFHFNLNALASIALLVGLFLIYNTVSISVITRRDEIGMLRASGAARRLVIALFLGEAFALAAIGTLIGLPLGVLMASAAVRATATTVETFYIASAATESITLQSLSLPELAAAAFAVALPLSLAAAAMPALEASRVQPVEAIRGAERLAKSAKASSKHVAVAAALFALGYALSRLGPVDGLPVFGYLSALAMMFGGAFLVPAALVAVCRAAGLLIGRLVRVIQVEGKLASANLRGAIGRVSISVAALAVSLAMMVAISIMIGSFRDTVSYWVDQTLRADIFARPLARTTSYSEGAISNEAVEAIRADARVAAVDAFTVRQVSYEGNLISLGAGDFATLIEYGRLLFKSPADAPSRIRTAIGRDEVVVSESFSMRFDKQPGDVVELPTAAGVRPFTVAAVFYDYSNNRGAAVMDRATFARHFNDTAPSNLSIYLHPGSDANEVRDDLARRVGNRFQIVMTTNAAVRREVMRIFDSTFAITYALEVIAMIVAGLGVVSTLIALILERQGEFAVLSFLGATRAQIRRMVVIEAVLIGGVSQIIGILIGVMLSMVLIYVINVQSFGWTIQFHLPLDFLIQSTLLIVAVTALAGLYPAARAASVNALRFAREE